MPTKSFKKNAKWEQGLRPYFEYRDLGIVKATKLPKRVPPEIESPIITVIPIMASIIERRPIIETFSFK